MKKSKFEKFEVLARHRNFKAQYYRNLALAESLQPRIRKFLNSFAFNNSFQLNALLLELNIWHYASNFI